MMLIATSSILREINYHTYLTSVIVSTYVGYNTSIISRHSQQYINCRYKKNQAYCYSSYLHITFLHKAIVHRSVFVPLSNKGKRCADMCTHGRHRMVTGTRKTTNVRARFFYGTFIYWLANLLIDPTFLY